MPGGDGIELLDKIKDFNPELPTLMFITGFADLTLEEAYNKGADAVFSKPFDRKELLTAIIKATNTKQEIWGERKADRVDVDFKIKLKLPALSTATQGRVLKIGRGGAFVAIDDKLPVVGTEVSFKIDFNEGAPPELAGSGIVRWIRPTTNENKPKGVGIEFLHLSNESRDAIITLIQKLKTKAFIPRA
jgi:Tfp pilus assembly protein PilZ